MSASRPWSVAELDAAIARQEAALAVQRGDLARRRASLLDVGQAQGAVGRMEAALDALRLRRSRRLGEEQAQAGVAGRGQRR